MSKTSSPAPPESNDSSGVDPFSELSESERLALIEVRELALRGNHRDARTKLAAIVADESFSDASKTIATSLRRGLGVDPVAAVVGVLALGIMLVVFVLVTGT